ncbi:MAG: methyltransferase domain-containing protein [Anaerolineales bacterium]|nr:methyltransferase domain-containing protein [Anaerolineales bacterium]
MNPDNDFPALYHAHHSLQLEDLPFWFDMAKRFSAPILELGCGTGRIFSPLSKAGYKLIGIDNDIDMLSYLRNHWDGNASPALFLADMTSFHLRPIFRLVILPCNTYSTLTVEQRRSVLACVRGCLKKNGAFVVSMPNPDLLKRLPKESTVEVEEIFPHPVDGEPVQVSSAWKRTQDIFSLTWYYDRLFPDGHVKRSTTQICHYIQNSDLYVEEFRQAGFEDVATFGDFDKSPFGDDSPNLIVVAS